MALFKDGIKVGFWGLDYSWVAPHHASLVSKTRSDHCLITLLYNSGGLPPTELLHIKWTHICIVTRLQRGRTVSHSHRLSLDKFRAYFYICIYIFRVMTHRSQSGHVLTRAAQNCRVETEIRSELYPAAGVVTKRDTLARAPPTKRSSPRVINQSCVELTGENEAVESVFFKGPRPIPLLIGFRVTEGHTSCHWSNNEISEERRITVGLASIQLHDTG